MEKRAWVLSVDMGYGHQRAAYPLKDIAEEKILTANTDYVSNWKERFLWRASQSGYEAVSRAKNIPFIGSSIFNMYDKLQSISPFYPFNKLENPNGNVYFLKTLIKMGLCKELLEHIEEKDIPVITTHFIPSLAADYNGFEKIFSIITDTDINRVWVSDDPKKSKIKFLTPTRHASIRLLKYGVDSCNIFITGFPLPKENIGENQEILKEDLLKRIKILDPKERFISVYKDIIEKYLGQIPSKVDRPLTLCYMVGGAGAQKDIGIKIVKSLKDKIKEGKVRVILVAGIREDVKDYFETELEKIFLNKNENVKIIFERSKMSYFETFNRELRNVDIIWTKPSELSFYTALGLPIIIAPPVGAHEHFNQRWLTHIGSGFAQDEPEYVNDWLFYVLESGRYAEAAWDGYMRAPTMGAYRIENIIKEGIVEVCKGDFTDLR
ncbi:MAG: hypothetical protein ABIN05_06265 [candidate division WOR-3 bacterium]